MFNFYFWCCGVRLRILSTNFAGTAGAYNRINYLLIWLLVLPMPLVIFPDWTVHYIRAFRFMCSFLLIFLVVPVLVIFHSLQDFAEQGYLSPQSS